MQVLFVNKTRASALRWRLKAMSLPWERGATTFSLLILALYISFLAQGIPGLGRALWGMSISLVRRADGASPLRATESYSVVRARTTTWAMRTSQYEIVRSEEHTSELQSLAYLVCRLL